MSLIPLSGGAYDGKMLDDAGCSRWGDYLIIYADPDLAATCYLLYSNGQARLVPRDQVRWSTALAFRASELKEA